MNCIGVLLLDSNFFSVPESTAHLSTREVVIGEKGSVKSSKIKI